MLINRSDEWTPIFKNIRKKFFYSVFISLFYSNFFTTVVQEEAKKLPKKGRFCWIRKNPVKTLGIFAGVLVSLFFGKRRCDNRHVRALENANICLRSALLQIPANYTFRQGGNNVFGYILSEEEKITFFRVVIKVHIAFEDAKKAFEKKFKSAKLTPDLIRIRKLLEILDFSECALPIDIRLKIRAFREDCRKERIEGDKALAFMYSVQSSYACFLFLLRDEFLEEFLRVIRQGANAAQ